MSTSSTAADGAPAVKTFHAKLVLLGDASVGKSSVVSRFAKEEFDEYQDPTIGAAFVTQSLRIQDDTVVRFEIWDTAGSERYRALAPMYYRGAAAAVVVYDITNRDSFENSKAWIAELKGHRTDTETVIALAGNKTDLDESRTVSTEEGEKYANLQGILFRETSAKTGFNVGDLFRDIGLNLPKRIKHEQEIPAGFQINPQSSPSSQAPASSVWASCCKII